MIQILNTSDQVADFEAIALELAAVERANANLVLSNSLVQMHLTSAELASASLLPLQFGITDFELIAVETAAASIALTNKGLLELITVEKTSALLGLRVLRQTASKMILTVRIVPRTRTARRHKDKHRFSVDGSEVPIQSYSVNFPEDAAGCQVNVTLAKFADRSLIAPGASYKFELGKKIAGVWHWRTIIDSGELQRASLTIGFADRKNTDTFTLTTLEPLASRLGKSPLNDLVIYDPFRSDISENDFKIIFDTEGNQFSTELLPVSNLTVYKLFDEILIERCGFPGYKTNIPDTPLEEAKFSTSGTFMTGLGEAIGVFEPDFSEIAGSLWIRDSTALLPEGFPAPLALTVDDYVSAGVNSARRIIDAFRIIYREDRDDWDYWQVHVETLPVEVSGTNGLDDYSETSITRYSRRYYRESQPNIVVKEDMYREVRRTRDNFGVTGEVEELFYYDGKGRPFRTQKTVKTLVPAFSDPDSTLRILKVVREEKTKYTYGRHPFEPNKQIQTRMLRMVYGQIMVDSQNLYRNEPFRQPVVVAHRSGNISDSATEEYGAIEKYTETIQVLPAEQVRVVGRKEDLVTKNTEFDYSDVRYGDASSGETGRTRELLVFENPGDTFTGKGEESLPVGYLPPEIAVPLARRKLIKRRARPEDMDIAFNGLELFMDRGIAYTLYDRESGSLGVFTVKGFRFTGRNLGTRQQTHDTTFKGARV